MTTSQHGNLFRSSGPGATLDYLRSRLDSRDLGQDEALALISVVHRELGRSKSEEPGVYASYSRFMEALSRQMPVVHDFVIAKWSESRYAGRQQMRDPETGIDETAAEAEAAGSPPAEVAVQKSQAERQDQEAGIAEGEGPEEPGEPDEEEQPEAGGAEAAGAREAHTEAGEADDEAPEAEPDEREDREKEEPEEIEDSADGAGAQEDGQEPEQLEAEQDQQEEAEQEETEGEQSEGEEQPEQEADSAEGEAPEPEAVEAEKGEEEGEWPAEEELEAPEPLDGEEGGEAAAE